MDRLATKHPLYAIPQISHCEKYGFKVARKQAAGERILSNTIPHSVIQ
jgi:hypothetical protein